MGRTLYSIRDWNAHFEKAQSRKIDGPLTWVAVPTKHDGLGYQRVMRSDPSLYAAWVLILQVAAKCPTRGVLADENGPLDAEDLSLKTGAPTELFDKALKLLSSDKVGWISRSSVVAEREPGGATVQDSTGHNTTEQEETASAVCPATSHAAGVGPSVETVATKAGDDSSRQSSAMTFPVDGKGSREWMLTQEKLREYQEAYPELDVVGEFRRALQWVKTNPENRKTAGGMPRFLTRWLNRAINNRRGNGSAGGSSKPPRPPIKRPEGF